MLASVTEELRDIRRVVNDSGILLGYAENYIYAPSVQREREIIETTKAQILRMTAEESHSGSHSPVYGIWSEQGDRQGLPSTRRRAVSEAQRRHGAQWQADPPGGGELP